MRYRRKKFTFAILSPDEFLLLHKTTRLSIIYIHKKRGGCSSNNSRDIGVGQRQSWICVEKSVSRIRCSHKETRDTQACVMGFHSEPMTHTCVMGL